MQKKLQPAAWTPQNLSGEAFGVEPIQQAPSAARRFYGPRSGWLDFGFYFEEPNKKGWTDTLHEETL